MIKAMYGALIEHLPFDLCHEIVRDGCEFTATPEDAKRYANEFMRNFDGDIFRVHHCNNTSENDWVITCDPLSRGITDHEQRDIEDRIRDFPLESLFAPVWETDYNIDQIGKIRNYDLSELIISDFWDIGTCGDGYAELMSTFRIVEKRSRHRGWTTIMSAMVTDGTVTRNWKEGGNMYLEPTEWFVKIGPNGNKKMRV
jgi:hypothetical protein